MQFSKKDIFTIPNIMSYFRILLVPAFVVVYMNTCLPQNYRVVGHVFSIVIIAASAITDVFDGRVARRFNQITDLGKILDPIADKAMQFAILFCLIVKYRSLIFLLVLFAVKELVSLSFSGYLFAHNKNIGGAMWCGKICTVIFYGVMFAFLILPHIGHPADYILIAVSSAFMILAFVVYMRAYILLLIELRHEQNSDPESDR